MDKLVPFHQLNPPLPQNPLTHRSPGAIHAPTSLTFGFSQTTSESPLFVAPTRPLSTLNSVQALHAQMMKMPNHVLPSNLITYYLEFGDFTSAATVFFMGSVRNYSVWNSFLEEVVSYGGHIHMVLEVFKELHRKGVMFDSRTLTIVLKICTSVVELWLGLEIHACLIKRGFTLDVFLNCALMNYYGKCWGIDSANKVFYEMPEREHLLWNEAIMVNLRNERWVKALELFRDMQFSMVKANDTTIVKVLQACGKLRALGGGKQIHGYVIRHELASSLPICNSLISMYSRNERIELARAVFDSMSGHNLSSWNSITSGYATLGYLDEALDMFYKMESSDVKPDIITWNCLLSGHVLHESYEVVLTILRRMEGRNFKPNASSITSALQAVIELGFLNIGKEIHAFVIKNGLDYDVHVGTSLLNMYVKNDCLTTAEVVFSNMKNKNIFAWNLLISAYSYKGLFEDAENLLNQMDNEGIKPDLVTWNGLLSGYAMWGCSLEAMSTIHRVKNSGLTPNVISWTAAISGCSQKGNYNESLKFFVQMQQEGTQPNSATISSLLRTCGGLAVLEKGKEIHCFSIRKSFIEDAFVATAVVYMYSKAGNLKSANEVFSKIQNKTLATWNCMIMGFAIYGLGKHAISLFNEMQDEGIQPDAITFTALLSSCKSSGLVDEGWKYFDAMSNVYDIIPTIEHYSCMVDLLGRAGYLDEAWDFIQTMPVKPDASIWGALLGSCRIHKNIKFAEIAAKNLFKLEPYNSANYVMMMNIYSMLNKWENVERIKDLMSTTGVKTAHVWSWIQIDQTVHAFFAEGKPHLDAGEIYFELYQLVSEMKKLGYVPDINCVFQNIDEVEKEKVLLTHTEKLAVTYGLIKMKSSSLIRVIKNTRVCLDCHSAIKYMSQLRQREIFLKDGVRFHHFRDGKCSCNDNW